MTRDNGLNFGVVREDPLIELEVIKQYRPKKILLIGSGGCTALSLASYKPDLEITAFDRNPAQIHHIQQKLKLIENSECLKAAPLNAVLTLNESGKFERLFHHFRQFIYSHILPQPELLAACQGDDALVNSLIKNTYWPVAFDLFFHDRYLEAIFGTAAIQNASPLPYSRYFQGILERELSSERRAQNYFLHHLLLGSYLIEAGILPFYLKNPPKFPKLELVTGSLENISDLSSYDLVSLSNVFDWMSDEEVLSTVSTLSTLRTGAVVLIRQLNNDKDLSSNVRPYFEINSEFSESLLKQDRSLFYSKFNVAVRIAL